MNLILNVDEDSLAESISELDYELAVKLFLRVDEIQSDSAFTATVLAAFEDRWYEIQEDKS